jgi:hypothetical protein
MIVHLYRCSTCGKVGAFTQNEHEMRELARVPRKGGHYWSSGQPCEGSFEPFVQFAVELAR